MADRTGGPREQAQQILRNKAGPARWQKMMEATSRLAKQPKPSAEAQLLIDRWPELALDLAEQLRRERQRAQDNAKRQQKAVSSRSTRAFFWGFALGAAMVGSVAIFLWMKQP